MEKDLQTPFDIAVAMTTVVRPTIVQAIRSIFAQQFPGRIQILVGIDRWEGPRSLLDELIAECPSHIAVTVLDLGYSTSTRHGGLHPSSFGGALKTILSYAANSRYVTYLDDDNWFSPTHLETMRAAIDNKHWAYALRYFVDKDTDDLLCPAAWEQLGEAAVLPQEAFVDTNCYLIDKLACHDIFPEWANTRYEGGTGGDRQIFDRLRGRARGSNNACSVYYRVKLAGLPPFLLWRFKCAGVDLARYLPASAIPADSVWELCAVLDRQQKALTVPARKAAPR